MSDLDLDEARKLAEAATPGPWRWNELVQLEGPSYVEDYGSGPETFRVTIIETDNGVYPPEEDDAAFIAASRTLVPALIAEVERLRAERDDLITRRDELLATIVRLTNETPFADEARDALEQRGKLLAEIGTLRAERETWRAVAAERGETIDALVVERDEARVALLDRVPVISDGHDAIEQRTVAAIVNWLERLIGEGIERERPCLIESLRAGRWKP